MRVIEANPEMSQRKIARQLGISMGEVNNSMTALIEQGLVQTRDFGRSDNKLGYVYLLTPAGMTQKTELAGSFLSRGLQEYEVLKQEIDTLGLEVGDSGGVGP